MLKSVLYQTRLIIIIFVEYININSPVGVVSFAGESVSVSGVATICAGVVLDKLSTVLSKMCSVLSGQRVNLELLG